MPSRLIYVGPFNQPLNPRLYISEMVTQETELRYTTLSHCWGCLKIFRLLSSNINDLVDKIPLEELSQVFIDAMDLTRRLGIEYIWIDSLCIIQDSYDDWSTESTKMGSVYRHSWCNIAATGFPDGSAGMYIERHTSLSQPRKFNLDLRDGDVPVTRSCQGKYYCMENLWLSEVDNAPLNTRAWVFQERVLSPRVLHLGSRQILWECKELEACERFPDGIPKPLKSSFKAIHTVEANLSDYNVGAPANEDIEEMEDHKSHEADESSDEAVEGNANDENDENDKDENENDELDEETEAYLSLLGRWNKMTYSYNDKNLTKYEDKLIAISGIAKEMQQAIGYEYVAGLWASRITLQLLWFVLTEGGQMGRIAKATTYQAPSWSWASINAPVGEMHDEETRKEAAKSLVAAVVEFNVTRKDENEFGQITGGFLRIFGPLTRATFVDSDTTLRAKWTVRNPPIELISRSKINVVVSPIMIPDFHMIVPKEVDSLPTFPLRDAIGTRDFWLLPICYTMRYQGIILQHTDVKGQYRRLGAWAQTDVTEEETERFMNHEPLLRDNEYDEVDEDGNPTITII